MDYLQQGVDRSGLCASVFIYLYRYLYIYIYTMYMYIYIEYITCSSASTGPAFARPSLALASWSEAYLYII